MAGLRLGVCAVGALALGAGCSGGGSSSTSTSTQAPPPSNPPRVPQVATADRDANRIDDILDADAHAIAKDLLSADPARRALGEARADEEVAVEAVFSRPMPADAPATFEKAGGSVRYVFRALSYGFTGTVPRSSLAPLATALGRDLLLLKAERIIELHLDEATKNARVRATWANGFAGLNGLSGSPTINVAIIDGGVDPTHPDLAGRMIGFHDYSSEALTSAADVLGHGSHVAGIALGSGASFGVGPGTLRMTESGDDSTIASNDWISNPVHLPPAFTLTGNATFAGGGTTTLTLFRGPDGSTVYSSSSATTGTSPISFSFDGTGGAGTHHTIGLRQDSGVNVGPFAIAEQLTNYPAVGDGFPALRGVAPSSGWYAAKIFPTQGVATTADINSAFDGVFLLRQSLNIKVVNCSFGISGGGQDPTQRAKVNTMVDNGMVVVASAGNNGPSGMTGDPGRASEVITVGAVNDINQLTSYTSGSATTDPDTDDKPDVVAPGGSSYRSKILSVDSNTADADNDKFADVQANDYTSIMGTSMAAPMVSGSAVLLIQALEAKGLTWDFGSPASSFLVKMLLLASATETNLPRETGATSPPLGRGAAPKDLLEGYGMINPDAAIEAATTTWSLAAPITGTTTGTVSDRRAWGRKITVPAGHTLKLSLSSPATADYDVYVYQAAPSAKGTPVPQAWSDQPGAGVADVLTWSFAPQSDLYLFVKLISGNGAFSLEGETFTCGNGKIEPGEQCDDGNVQNGDCCSVACQLEATACATDAGATTQGTDGGVADAGNEDAGVADAGADADADASSGADAAAPPFTEPDVDAGPPATAPSTSSGGTSGTVILPTPVERLEAGGGGCSSAPRSRTSPADFGAAFGIMLAWVAARRGNRKASSPSPIKPILR